MVCSVEEGTEKGKESRLTCCQRLVSRDLNMVAEMAYRASLFLLVSNAESFA